METSDQRAAHFQVGAFPVTDRAIELPARLAFDALLAFDADTIDAEAQGDQCCEPVDHLLLFLIIIAHSNPREVINRVPCYVTGWTSLFASTEFRTELFLIQNYFRLLE